MFVCLLWWVFVVVCVIVCCFDVYCMVGGLLYVLVVFGDVMNELYW